MLGTPPPKKKRRGNPDKYREYMREYMREYRARAKVVTSTIEPFSATGLAGDEPITSFEIPIKENVNEELLQ